MTDRDGPAEAAGLTARRVHTGERDGTPTRIALARRRYRADRADVWDAVTNAERLPRWFLPVEGDLRPGGHYQFEGNAGGTIEACEAPERLAATWEFAGGVSWIEVDLREAEGGTVLELTHESPVDPEFWEQFGPGAVGVGWDLGLYGLEQHLTTGEDLDAAEVEAWTLGPDGVAFVRRAAEDWARAAVDDGDDAERAAAAAERTIAFYTVPDEPTVR